MECNRTIICGKIVKLGVLRYTPAGVAVIEFTVSHVSRQKEAGLVRQIILDIFAVALGQLALTIAKFKIDSRVKLTGFLNRKSHMNPQLVLHAEHIELI
ncbi:MAG: primosomal replication protein N [Gammaproteobacteria bacterium]|nr:MAG: primosomal replication protein N [Gammaproteobacteria bacterium]